MAGMTLAARLGAGAIAALMTAALTAAVEVIVQEGPQPVPFRMAIIFAALFVIYGFLAVASVGLANLLWLAFRLVLARIEAVALPALTGLCHWLMLADGHWGLLTRRAITTSTLAIAVAYAALLLRQPRRARA